MPSSNRVRLPNKTQWALDDLGAAQIEARRIMGEILNWTAHQRTEAGLNMDKARMANIGKLDHHIAALALLLAESGATGERCAAGDLSAGVGRGVKIVSDNLKLSDTILHCRTFV